MPINGTNDDNTDNGNLEKHVDGGLKKDLYKKIPCTVGYTYARFEVDGTLRPCCIAKYGSGNLNNTKDSWLEIWHGLPQNNFRQKTGRIHEEHFHENDPEWGFCNHCSHRFLNQRNAIELGFLKPDEVYD